MNLTPLFVAFMVLVPAAGLVVCVLTAMAQVEDELCAFGGGMEGQSWL